jgi:hypothetical protein
MLASNNLYVQCMLRSMLTMNTAPRPMPTMVMVPQRDFSLKMRKVNEKYARVKKYKLKTKKAFQKRFRIVSSRRL